MQRHRLPPWLKKTWPERIGAYRRTSGIIQELQLHTICESGACPNRPECYAASHATLMLLGDTCTRRCPFCDVPFSPGGEVDEGEPGRVAEAVSRLGLKYVVLTSVTRDDLADGGSGHFSRTIHAIHKAVPDTRVEVLIPDFAGRMDCVDEVLAAGPDVLSHNIESVPRLYRSVRPGADYERSLSVLARVRARLSPAMTKSSLMLGLGETTEEVTEVFTGLAQAGCEAITLGQYLQPPSSRMRVREYLSPERFDRYADLARTHGIPWVKAGPFVRTSYLANTLLEERNKNLQPI